MFTIPCCENAVNKNVNNLEFGGQKGNWKESDAIRYFNVCDARSLIKNIFNFFYEFFLTKWTLKA